MLSWKDLDERRLASRKILMEQFMCNTSHTIRVYIDCIWSLEKPTFKDHLLPLMWAKSPRQTVANNKTQQQCTQIWKTTKRSTITNRLFCVAVCQFAYQYCQIVNIRSNIILINYFTRKVFINTNDEATFRLFYSKRLFIVLFL